MGFGDLQNYTTLKLSTPELEKDKVLEIYRITLLSNFPRQSTIFG